MRTVERAQDNEDDLTVMDTHTRLTLNEQRSREFWTGLRKAKVTDLLRARNWWGKLGREWRPQGAQGSIRAFAGDFHSYLPRAARRAVGAA